MKKSILLSLALLAPIVLSAAPTTEGDTIVVEKPQRVTVVTTDSIQHILVEGKEDNPHYTYSNTLQIEHQQGRFHHRIRMAQTGAKEYGPSVHLRTDSTFLYRIRQRARNAQGGRP